MNQPTNGKRNSLWLQKSWRVQRIKITEPVANHRTVIIFPHLCRGHWQNHMFVEQSWLGGTIFVHPLKFQKGTSCWSFEPTNMEIITTHLGPGILEFSIWLHSGTYSYFLSSEKSLKRYPLVIQHSELERSTMFNGKIHYFYSHFPVRKLLTSPEATMGSLLRRVIWPGPCAMDDSQVLPHFLSWKSPKTRPKQPQKDRKKLDTLTGKDRTSIYYIYIYVCIYINYIYIYMCIYIYNISSKEHFSESVEGCDSQVLRWLYIKIQS